MSEYFVPNLISVVMPCYNAAPFVEEAVRSVMNQTYPGVELIIVDDGSTDGSVDILQQLASEFSPRLNLLYQSRMGPYPARNLGLQLAQGEFVAFLDADDWWSLDCLENLHSALVNSKAVLAYCGWQNVGAVDRSNDPYVPPDYEQGNKAEQFLRAASPWPIHAALTRREAITAKGGFHIQWTTCMDYDLWLRVAVANRIVLVPEVMAFYRHKVSGQITSNQWVQAENTWLVKQKFVHTYPELVSHLGRDKLRQLIDGGLLSRGYRAYWRRDLVTSRHVFRKVLWHGGWKLPDLKYLLPALLPEQAYVKLVQVLSDR
jgi:glycosyltransferase involved in cell wall biosynthesis